MRRMLRLVCLSLLLPLLSLPAAAKEVFSGLTPVAVEGRLEPGLAVTYWRDIKFDLMLEMHEIIREIDGEPGDPVLRLVTGDDVLTTDGETFVAAVLKGVVNFAEAGRYEVAFVSNDGILVEVGDRLIYADPNRHADSSSGSIEIEIAEPGWYEVDIAYFQKKGTHRHEMYWLPPGSEGALTLVPAQAFAHVAGTRPGFETMPVPDATDTVIR